MISKTKLSRSIFSPDEVGCVILEVPYAWKQKQVLSKVWPQPCKLLPQSTGTAFSAKPSEIRAPAWTMLVTSVWAKELIAFQVWCRTAPTFLAIMLPLISTVLLWFSEQQETVLGVYRSVISNKDELLKLSHLTFCAVSCVPVCLYWQCLAIFPWMIEKTLVRGTLLNSVCWSALGSEWSQEKIPQIELSQLYNLLPLL